MLLWLVSSAAWAVSVNDMSFYSDSDRVFMRLEKDCREENKFSSTIAPKIRATPKRGECTLPDKANLMMLDISLVFGFSNAVLWAAGLWFNLKECPQVLSSVASLAQVSPYFVSMSSVVRVWVLRTLHDVQILDEWTDLDAGPGAVPGGGRRAAARRAGRPPDQLPGLVRAARCVSPFSFSFSFFSFLRSPLFPLLSAEASRLPSRSAHNCTSLHTPCSIYRTVYITTYEYYLCTFWSGSPTRVSLIETLSYGYTWVRIASASNAFFSLRVESQRVAPLAMPIHELFPVRCSADPPPPRLRLPLSLPLRLRLVTSCAARLREPHWLMRGCPLLSALHVPVTRAGISRRDMRRYSLYPRLTVSPPPVWIWIRMRRSQCASILLLTSVS